MGGRWLPVRWVPRLLHRRGTDWKVRWFGFTLSYVDFAVVFVTDKQTRRVIVVSRGDTSTIKNARSRVQTVFCTILYIIRPPLSPNNSYYLDTSYPMAPVCPESPGAADKCDKCLFALTSRGFYSPKGE